MKVRFTFCTKIISFPGYKINTLRAYIRADFTHTRARARFILIYFFLIHSPRLPWIYVTFPLHPTKAVGGWSPGCNGPAVPKAAQHKITV